MIAWPSFRTLLYIVIATIILACVIRIRKWLRIFILTSRRDLMGLFLMVRVKFAINQARRSNATVHSLFEEQAVRNPDRILFYYHGRSWTFEDIQLYSRRFANILIDLGLQQGDEVALFAESRPEYVGAWLACSQAGIVVGLVNSSLRSFSLIHSLNVIKPKALIFGSELRHGKILT